MNYQQFQQGAFVQIQFNAVSGYLQLNQQSSRQTLVQQLQAFHGQLQQRPDIQQTLVQSPKGQAFLNALVNATMNQISTQDIESIQTFIVDQGYDIRTTKVPSGIDGKYGPKTHGALSQIFEKWGATQPAAPAPSGDQAPAVPPQASALPTLPPEFSLYKESPDNEVPATEPDQPRRTAPSPSEPGVARVEGENVYSRTADSIDQWYLAQFDGQSDSPHTDCGPATVAMILRANKLGDFSNLETVRHLMGSKHNNATTSLELARGIEAGSNQQLDALVIEGEKHYADNPDGFLAQMKSQLAAGREIILLTKNMATQENGHYVVVTGVTEDNDLIVADPGNRAKGKNRTFSYQDFLRAYRKREQENMPNHMITVRRQIAAG